jgi:hypothetical protein
MYVLKKLSARPIFMGRLNESCEWFRAKNGCSISMRLIMMKVFRCNNNEFWVYIGKHEVARAAASGHAQDFI